MIYIFTDGSAVDNGKKTATAGCGVYFTYRHMNDSEREDEIDIFINKSGQRLPDEISEPFLYENPTNQRAELYAIVLALEKIKKNKIDGPIIIVSDSDYAIKCVTVWIKNWIKNNFKTAKGKPVKNANLIKKISHLINIEIDNIIAFQHVNSHTGKKDFFSKGNNKADILAKKGRLKQYKIKKIQLIVLLKKKVK